MEENMEKKIKQVVKKHPRKYEPEVVQKVLTLIREQKTLPEILEQVPCRKSCIRRISRKNSLVIRKDKEAVKK